MRKRLPSRAQRGFTMLEIVIVFVLIAGLMAFVVPKIFEQMGTRQVARGEDPPADARGRDRDLQARGRAAIPTTLQSLVKQPAGVDKWNGPYAKDADLKDAWGNDYRYTTPGTNRAYDLVSLGADGKEGGDGREQGHHELTCAAAAPDSRCSRSSSCSRWARRCTRSSLSIPFGKASAADLKAAARSRRLGAAHGAEHRAWRRGAMPLLTLDMESREFITTGEHEPHQLPEQHRPEALHRAIRGDERAARLDPLLSRRQLHRRARHGRIGRAQVPGGRGLAHRAGSRSDE